MSAPAHGRVLRSQAGKPDKSPPKRRDNKSDDSQSGSDSDNAGKRNAGRKRKKLRKEEDGALEGAERHEAPSAASKELMKVGSV